MKTPNDFQKRFLNALGRIQENSVQTALCAADAEETVEDLLYDVTADVIIRIAELLDGYSDCGIGPLEVCTQTGESLKKDPYIELHDAVCEYLKIPK